MIIIELTKRCYNFKKYISFEIFFSHLKQKGDKTLSMTLWFPILNGHQRNWNSLL